MGGAMWVESEAGFGSTFHFTVQIERLAATSVETWEEKRPHLDGRRVLVIEDSDTNRRILKYWLERFGMRCVAVATAQEAQQLLQLENTFDAAIIDLELPDTDALSMAEAMRKLPGGQALDLLLLTSARLRVGDVRVAQTRISASIHKPIRPIQLFDALSQSFDRRPASQRKPPATMAFDPLLASRIPLRILMADDNRINQKVGRGFLAKLGYRADVVSNGLEVIEAMQRQPYDLIFLDIQMPEMDGYETARQIQRRWAERPRIVAMTGNAMQGDREKCLAAGMDDYIVKPVRIDDLKATLERWGPPRTTNTHEPEKKAS
jgi:CheY-like chemotaxis protein